MYFVPEAGSCVERELRSLDFCEGLYAEVAAEGCQNQFNTYADCVFGTDECRDCRDLAQAVLACGQAPGTPCGELYYELDTGCLDREFEGDIDHCTRIYGDPVYDDCRTDYEDYARCLAEIPFTGADSCPGPCDPTAADLCLGR